MPAARPPKLLAARAALLLLAGGAALGALVFIPRHDVPGGAVAGVETFFCPMHPAVSAAVPGECPICRMALEPRGTVTRPTSGASRAPGRAAAPRVTLRKGTKTLTDADLAPAKRRTFRRAITGPAQIARGGAGLAILYAGDWEPGETATFRSSARPDAAFAVRLMVGGRSGRGAGIEEVSLEAAGPGAPDAAAVGWIELPARNRPALTVPSSAVVDASDGAAVYVAAADRRTFFRCPVTIGRGAAGFVPVLTGLEEGERVVTARASFLEAERRLAEIAGDGEAAPP